MVKGIGTDIVEIVRIERACAKYQDRFLRHVFTDFEISYAKSKANPYASFAVRFAAKEAFAKAVRQGQVEPIISWLDFSLQINSNGIPEPVLTEKARGLIGADSTVHVTVSHGQDYGVAFVLIEGIGPTTG